MPRGTGAASLAENRASVEGSRVSDMPSVAASIELSPQQAAPDPVDILVVGSDALGVDVCRLLHDAGRRVVAIWATDAPTLDDVQLIAIRCVAGDARRAPLLSRAGVRVAGTILAVTSDDQFNLRVALTARDLNPGIRIVLRQFNRRLGQKIVRQLANAEAVSPETHSAATYAASCLNPYVYHALEFPRYSEKLIAFCRGTAAQFAVAGASVGDVRRKRGWHVLAVGDRPFCDDETPVGADDLLTIACRVEAAPSGSIAPSGGDGSSATDAILFEHPRRGIAHWLRHARLDPIFLGLFAGLIVLLAGSAAYFHSAIGLRWVEAIYHVVNTVTTTGSDVISPLTDATRLVEIILMLGGIGIIGVLLAYVTAAITRRGIELAQGRHQYLGAGHIIICGFGNVGSRVAQYLQYQDYRIAVIDRAPDAALAEEARGRGAHIMTADATSESALSLANVQRAAALLALTDGDSANLEIALTAAAYAPELPIIMRISEAATARAVERHFKVRASYSAAELAAPLVAGLALEPGSRGSVDVAGAPCSLVQRRRTAPAAAGEVELAADDDVVLIVRKSGRPA